MDAALFRRGSESERTYRLKWAAWEWRYNTAGCRCIGFEVRRHGPWGRIVDVAAVGPGNQFYVVEVKSSRADFARDNRTDADVARLAIAQPPCPGASRWPKRRAIVPAMTTGNGWRGNGNGWRQYPPSFTPRAFRRRPIITNLWC